MSASFAVERSSAVRAPKRVRVSSMPNVVPLRPVPARERDRSLFDGLRRGEPKVVAQVYTLHHASVRAFARRMLGDVESAEDVVHDVFVALPAAAKRFRGEASLKTFLTGIALNLCRRRLRKAVRRRRAMRRLKEGTMNEGPRTPEAETRRRRLANVLQRGLQTLPLPQREAFILCAVEEMSSPEASAILEVPEGTVRTRLFHARRKLRAFLEAEGVS